MNDESSSTTEEVYLCRGKETVVPSGRGSQKRTYMCNGQPIHRVTFWKHRKNGCPYYDAVHASKRSKKSPKITPLATTPLVSKSKSVSTSTFVNNESATTTAPFPTFPELPSLLSDLEYGQDSSYTVFTFPKSSFLIPQPTVVSSPPESKSYLEQDFTFADLLE